MKCAILFVALFSLSVCGADAAILNVDLNGAHGVVPGNTYSGNGVLRADGSTNDNPAAGTTSGHWNGIDFPADANTPVPSSGLLDSGLSLTTVTLSFANWTQQDNCAGCQYASPGANPSNMSLLNDFLDATNPSPSSLPTMTIGGLNANQAFTLFVYGTNGGSNGGGTWSVNGSATKQTTGSGVGAFSTFSNGDDYVKFNVTSDAMGQLVVTGAAGPIANFVALDGFQLSPAPEPASLSLLGIGAIGLLARRRRV